MAAGFERGDARPVRPLDTGPFDPQHRTTLELAETLDVVFIAVVDECGATTLYPAKSIDLVRIKMRNVSMLVSNTKQLTLRCFVEFSYNGFTEET